MDRDIKLIGLMAAVSSLNLCGESVADLAIRGAHISNAEMIPRGRVVADPVYRALMEDEGIDPDRVWYPPIGARPGEYTLNDLVEWASKNARSGLGGFLGPGRGTERGEVEVDLVNGLVADFFPLVSDPGFEFESHLSGDSKLLHDILSEDLVPPDGLTGDALLEWCGAMLEKYKNREGGG